MTTSSKGFAASPHGGLGGAPTPRIGRLIGGARLRRGGDLGSGGAALSRDEAAAGGAQGTVGRPLFVHGAAALAWHARRERDRRQHVGLA
jgi:hypothetical protein